jgi:hypothetical protein
MRSDVVPSNPPAAWYPDPVDASQYRYWDGQQWTEHRAPATTEQLQQPQPKVRGEKWNTPETWAALGTAFVLIPVTSRASRAAVDAGASHWAVAAVTAAIAVAAAVLLKSGTGKARDGVLFGLYLTFTLAAIFATAKALDVWEGWVMIAVVVPILTVQWLRYRHREESPA